MNTERLQKEYSKVVLGMRRLWELLLEEVSLDALVGLLNCELDGYTGAYILYRRTANMLQRAVHQSGCVVQGWCHDPMELSAFKSYYDGNRGLVKEMQTIIRDSVVNGCSEAVLGYMEKLNKRTGVQMGPSPFPCFELGTGLEFEDDSVIPFLPEVWLGGQVSHAWLSLVVQGAVFLEPGTLQQCAAGGCNKFFLPNTHGRQQVYHSPTCRSRENSRKRRSGLREVKNG